VSCVFALQTHRQVLPLQNVNPVTKDAKEKQDHDNHEASRILGKLELNALKPVEWWVWNFLLRERERGGGEKEGEKRVRDCCCFDGEEKVWSLGLTKTRTTMSLLDLKISEKSRTRCRRR
jgi:hypothetical protein